MVTVPGLVPTWVAPRRFFEDARGLVRRESVAVLLGDQGEILDLPVFPPSRCPSQALIMSSPAIGPMSSKFTACLFLPIVIGPLARVALLKRLLSSARLWGFRPSPPSHMKPDPAPNAGACQPARSRAHHQLWSFPETASLSPRRAGQLKSIPVPQHRLSLDTGDDSLA